jgi:hypothetical protein
MQHNKNIVPCLLTMKFLEITYTKNILRYLSNKSQLVDSVITLDKHVVVVYKLSE